MKAVITGITGFAGQFLAEHLLAAGDEVLGYSRSGVWPEHTPDGLPDRVPLCAWDVTLPSAGCEERDSIRDFQPDCVYHLAAMSVPADCGKQLPAAAAAAVNVGGTAAVMELAAALPKKPRVLFISTSHVYGAAVNQQVRLREDGPLAPRTGYGWSKWLAETVLEWFARDAGLEIIVARGFQHTGPRQHTRMMLPNWAQQFACGAAPVQVYNRSTTIDLTDVRDVVRAYRLLMLHGRGGEIYNVGSGVPRTTGEILDMLREAADPAREIVELYPGTRFDPVADIERIVARTGWQVEIPLAQCVADTYRFWLNER